MKHIKYLIIFLSVLFLFPTVIYLVLNYWDYKKYYKLEGMEWLKKYDRNLLNIEFNNHNWCMQKDKLYREAYNKGWYEYF